MDVSAGQCCRSPGFDAQVIRTGTADWASGGTPACAAGSSIAGTVVSASAAGPSVGEVATSSASAGDARSQTEHNRPDNAAIRWTMHTPSPGRLPARTVPGHAKAAAGARTSLKERDLVVSRAEKG